MMAEYEIMFHSENKSDWLRTVTGSLSKYTHAKGEEKVVISVADGFSPTEIKPLHVVTYACLIHELGNRGYYVCQGMNSNIDVSSYLYNDLGLKKYWKGSNHEETSNPDILNLWRVIESEQEFFSDRVTGYFKNKYFQGKDLSSVKLSLLEAFYNISDHANAKGNAYCQMRYYKEEMKLDIAVVDLGIGLVNTVKAFDPSITNDQDALLRAIDEDFTISSTTHNKGKGLSNILSSSSIARIISGQGMLIYNKNIKTFGLDFEFPGTLVYYEIDLSNLEDEDFCEEFSF